METDHVAEPAPIREIRITLAPEPGAMTDPSKYIVQYSWVMSGVRS